MCPLTWVVVSIAPQNGHPEFPGLWRLFVAPRHGNREFPRLSGDSGCAAKLKPRAPQTWAAVSKHPKFQRLASWFASSWKPRVPRFGELLKTPRFHRAVKCGNPWFHQGRDMETPSFPGLGAGARHGNPESQQAWAPPVSVVARLGNPKFPRLGRRRFRSWRDMETPSFPGLGRRGTTWKPRNVCAGRNPQILGATWKPQVSPGLGATWKPQIFSAGRNPQILGATWKPQIFGATWNPKFWAPGGNPKILGGVARHGNPSFPGLRRLFPRGVETPNFPPPKQ